ncbi:NTP transferase domain-containing protein [Spongiactinospora gelatinilytica]|uniref:NTP transferase domain-containing protein n=1 Tax=Spongiactinospora gelatinilytica TaxID=2666298 RepID=UPI0027B98DFE|nr:NTP transferase domain-containing protein [Spongiactinospora gelatinilytica]
MPGGTGIVHDAVILAGGGARRLGGRDKPAMVVAGRTLLERVADAVPEAGRLIVVGPSRPLPGAVFAREHPPGGGPVPALRAGLAEVTGPWLALLAADLPFLTGAHVHGLLAAAQGRAGAVLLDAGGREQWLVGVWRTAALREALAAYDGRSLHGLLAPLAPAGLALPGTPWFDCDTMDDLRQARQGAEMNVLAEWTALVCAELGLDPGRVDRDLVLDLTKDVAHGVARPAAPLTAYLLGLAEGQGTAPADAAERLAALARGFERREADSTAE